MYKRQNRRHLQHWTGRMTSVGLTLSLSIIMLPAQTDPGPRGGVAGAGNPLSGLGNKESQNFSRGLDAFQEVASVQGTIAGTEPGLGPRFNLNSCAGCHSQPAVGGSSPAVNPQGPGDSYDPDEPGVEKHVQRGGSFLCSDAYCIRYKAGSRGKGETSSAGNNLGFRCVKDIVAGKR